MPLGFQFRLQWYAAKLAIEPKMRRDFRRRVHGKVSTRKAFQEAFDLRTGRTARGRLDLREQGSFIRSMQPIGIETTAQMICRGYKELPEHFGLPRSQSFGIDRVDVRVGQQTQALQAFQCRNRRSESRHCRWVENVAPLYRS